MTRESKKGETYRHAPAFILLFLARENLYGASLLSKMQEELPRCFADSAVIYRSLQELEEDGSVEACWETDVSGPARKWYAITARGYERLAQFKEDIEIRKKNLEFFLKSYKIIVKKD
jgi:DNA-binding PadR family transcriptional regulator